MRYARAIAAAAAGLLALVQPLKAQEPEQESNWGHYIEAGVSRNYTLRGLNWGDYVPLQAYAEQSNERVAFWIFGNLNLEDIDFNECDVGANLSFKTGPVNLNAGAAAYHFKFPGESKFTTTYELTGSAGLDLPSQPTLMVVRDLKETDNGTYIELSAIKELGGIRFKPSVAYNHKYWISNSDISHAGLLAEKTFSIGDKVLVTPYAYGQFAMNSPEIKDRINLGFRLGF